MPSWLLLGGAVAVAAAALWFSRGNAAGTAGGPLGGDTSQDQGGAQGSSGSGPTASLATALNADQGGVGVAPSPAQEMAASGVSAPPRYLGLAPTGQPPPYLGLGPTGQPPPYLGLGPVGQPPPYLGLGEGLGFTGLRATSSGAVSLAQHAQVFA